MLYWPDLSRWGARLDLVWHPARRRRMLRLRINAEELARAVLGVSFEEAKEEQRGLAGREVRAGLAAAGFAIDAGGAIEDGNSRTYECWAQQFGGLTREALSKIFPGLTAVDFQPVKDRAAIEGVARQWVDASQWQEWIAERRIFCGLGASGALVRTAPGAMPEVFYQGTEGGWEEAPRAAVDNLESSCVCTQRMVHVLAQDGTLDGLVEVWVSEDDCRQAQGEPETDRALQRATLPHALPVAYDPERRSFWVVPDATYSRSVSQWWRGDLATVVEKAAMAAESIDAVRGVGEKLKRTIHAFEKADEEARREAYETALGALSDAVRQYCLGRANGEEEEESLAGWAKLLGPSIEQAGWFTQLKLDRWGMVQGLKRMNQEATQRVASNTAREWLTERRTRLAEKMIEVIGVDKDPAAHGHPWSTWDYVTYLNETLPDTVIRDVCLAQGAFTGENARTRAEEWRQQQDDALRTAARGTWCRASAQAGDSETARAFWYGAMADGVGGVVGKVRSEPVGFAELAEALVYREVRAECDRIGKALRAEADEAHFGALHGAGVAVGTRLPQLAIKGQVCREVQVLALSPERGEVTVRAERRRGRQASQEVFTLTVREFAELMGVAERLLYQQTREQYFQDQTRVRRDVARTFATDLPRGKTAQKSKVQVSYEYVDPSPAGPFRGRVDASPGAYVKGQLFAASFGVARVTRIARVLPGKAEEVDPSQLDLADVYAMGVDLHRMTVASALAQGKWVPAAVRAEFEREASGVLSPGDYVWCHIKRNELPAGRIFDRDVYCGTVRAVESTSRGRQRIDLALEERGARGEPVAARLYTDEAVFVQRRWRPVPVDVEVRDAEQRDGELTVAREDERARHDDVGQKLGGARKDEWSARLSVAEVGTMTPTERLQVVTKKRVWPSFDFEQMRAAGVEPAAAYFMQRLRTMVAAGPARAEDAEWYVRALHVVQEGLGQCRTVTEVIEACTRVRHKLQQEDREFDLSYIWTDDAPSNRVLGRPVMEVLHSAHRLAYQARHRTQDNTSWARVYRAKAAPAVGVEMAVESNDDESAQSVREREPTQWSRPHLDRLERDGPSWRHGRDIAGEELLETFGFRGIEWGNWVPQHERQAILNHAFEAFHDLADVLGLPPRMMSLNGALGIGFGSRGRGRFAAHFEPNRCVINLTRLSGAGSLAHEWGHAVDHWAAQEGKLPALWASEHAAAGKGVEKVMWLDEFLAAARAIRAQPQRIEEALAAARTLYVDALAHAQRCIVGYATYEHYSGIPRDTPEGSRYVERVTDLVEESLRRWVLDDTQGKVAEQLLVARQSGVLARLPEQLQRLYRAAGGTKRSFVGSTLDKIDTYFPWLEQRAADWAFLDEAHRGGAQFTPRYRGAAGEEGFVHKPTRFANDGSALDGKHRKYWGTPLELWARAFESYVYDALHARNRRSDYLVHSVEGAEWGDSAPCRYPRGEEREQMGERFGRVFEALAAYLRAPHREGAEHDAHEQVVGF